MLLSDGPISSAPISAETITARSLSATLTQADQTVSSAVQLIISLHGVNTQADQSVSATTTLVEILHADLTQSDQTVVATIAESDGLSLVASQDGQTVSAAAELALALDGTNTQADQTVDGELVHGSATSLDADITQDGNTVDATAVVSPIATQAEAPGTNDDNDAWTWRDTKRYWELQGVKLGRDKHDKQSAQLTEVAQAYATPATAEMPATPPARIEKLRVKLASALHARRGPARDLPVDYSVPPASQAPAPEAKKISPPPIQVPSKSVMLESPTVDEGDWSDDDLFFAAIVAASEWRSSHSV